MAPKYRKKAKDRLKPVFGLSIHGYGRNMAVHHGGHAEDPL